MKDPHSKSEGPARTIRARFHHGAFEPLERIEIPEGKEVTLAVMSPDSNRPSDWLGRSSGSWQSLVDAEQLKHDIAESRALPPRAEPRL
jgi:predicted DNA-binding antitoxin AbrB/MazE fold protein